MSVIYLWLIAGVLLFAAEAMGISGIGLMFAGIGAVMAGLAVSVGLVAVDALVAQWIVFFAFSAVSAALLWKPLQRLRVGKHHGNYSNIVGETAYVGSGGVTKESGEVTWSGTIMRAQLIPDAVVERLEPGTQVVIVDLRGITLHVKPKA